MILYCLCKKPYAGEAMVACDACQEWFHPKCIGLSESDIENLGNNPFFCPRCRAVKGLPPFRESLKNSSNAPIRGGIPAEIQEKRNRMQAMFLQAFQEHISDFPNLPAVSESGEPFYNDPKQLATDIEEAFFKAYSRKDATNVTSLDKRSTQKVYSLTFNLKRNDTLRHGLISRLISPEKFVQMSADDLADKELVDWRDSVRQKSVQNVVIPVDEDVMTIRKTRKGDEPILSDAQYDISSVPSLSGTTVITPRTSPDLASELDSYEKVRNNSISSSPPSVPTRSSKTSVDWKGVITFSGLGEFYASAYRISEENDNNSSFLSSVFPPLVGIQGRIAKEKADDFLVLLKSSSSKKIVLYAIVADKEYEETRATFSKVFNYLHSSEKYAVIGDKALLEYIALSRSIRPSAHLPQPAADVYLIPIPKNTGSENYLPFLSSSTIALVPKVEEDFFLAVMVIVNPKKPQHRPSLLTQQK